MNTFTKRSDTGMEHKAGLFSVLGPYKGIVSVLVIMALAGSSFNLLIPKIIARSIDAFSAGEFNARTVITKFLVAACGIFIATANIDTVTEQQLEAILKNLPASTNKVIIAHRLNTIENADEIFFVNLGKIIAAGSLNEALELLMQGKIQN